SSGTVLLGQIAAGSVDTLGGAVSLEGSVTTSGGAISVGGVTLTGDSTLTTSGGALTTKTIDGAHRLTLNPGAGAVTINGTIGGTTKVNGLVLNGSGTATIASVTALGSLDLSGKTAGLITFSGALH